MLAACRVHILRKVLNNLSAIGLINTESIDQQLSVLTFWIKVVYNYEAKLSWIIAYQHLQWDVINSVITAAH